MLLSSLDTLLYLLQYYLLCGHFARAVSNMMNIFFTILFFNFFEDFVMLIVHTQVTTYMSFYFYILITKIADINLWLIIDSNLDKTDTTFLKKQFTNTFIWCFLEILHSQFIMTTHFVIGRYFLHNDIHHWINIFIFLY